MLKSGCVFQVPAMAQLGMSYPVRLLNSKHNGLRRITRDTCDALMRTKSDCVELRTVRNSCEWDMLILTLTVNPSAWLVGA